MTTAECERWLENSQVRIIHDRFLEFASESAANSVSARIPTSPLRLNYFAIRITDWLSIGRTRLLWMRTWDTHPPNNIDFFEHARIGFGEGRQLIDAPGHLFESSSYSDYEQKPDVDRIEDAALSGFILLLMCFGWEGYAVTEGGRDFVYIENEIVEFSSADGQRTREAKRLVKEFDVVMTHK